MSYSVNWDSRVITVPQSDLVDLGGGIYKLDLELCHQELRRLEWEFTEGLSRLQILDYIPPLEAGGVIYARFVLLTNGYTFEFEDGQYAVNLSGANTNIHDYTVVNQVSIRPSNSAGLQDLSTLLAMAYMDRVVVDVFNGQAGIATPIGTLGSPSGNIPDAITIADNNSISTLLTIRDLALGDGHDVSGMRISGIDAGMTSLTIDTLAVCDDAIFTDLYVTGVLDGNSTMEECIIGNITYFAGMINHSSLAGTIQLDGNANAHIHACRLHDYDNAVFIDMGGSGQDLIMTEWTGKVTISNSDGDNTIGVGILGGMVVFDDTCTEGLATVSGDGIVVDNSGENFTVITTGLNNPYAIAQAVLDSDTECP